jgi:Na+/melibiose symporter-like transporter
MITSNITIDCNSAEATWTRIHGSSGGAFSCSTLLVPPKPKLSKGAKAGIGVGAFLLVVVLLLICWFLTRKVKKKNALKKAESHQLQERGNALDLSSIAATEVGSVHSEDTAVHGREGSEIAAAHGQDDNEESATVR